jgi:hypothetical protein
MLDQPFLTLDEVLVKLIVHIMHLKRDLSNHTKVQFYKCEIVYNLFHQSS